MEIKILYFGGCPNWRTAAERAQRALTGLGRPDIPVRAEDVTQSPVVSAEWGGSPTVLIDGHDAFGSDHSDLLAHTGLDACRVYPTENGLGGAPSVDQLRTAIEGALTRAHPQGH
jgi:hypothetical protein